MANRDPSEPGFRARLANLILSEKEARATILYRGMLTNKKRIKTVIPNIVPELRAPSTYAQFASVSEFAPPDESRFVLKPSSGSHSRGVYCLERTADGRLRDLTSDDDYSVESLREQYKADFERAQGKMSLSCFTEEYVDSEPGYSRPHDYKAYCFGGEVALIMQKAFVTKNKKDWRFKFWSPDWQSLGLVKYADRIDPQLPAPALGPEAVRLASALSEKIARPFVRIDLYITRKEVIFSEITPNPNGGKDYFNEEWDQILGRIWQRNEEAAAKISRHWIEHSGKTPTPK